MTQRFQFYPVVEQWFDRKFGSPTEPQEQGWPSIQARAHTLIAAPTGSGKTLAAFLASLDQLFREGLDGKLPDETRVIYVSPLKALSNDIHKNLEEPLAGIRAAFRIRDDRDIDVRAEVRTGDTPAAKRQAITRRPPHILATTPESFYLLLTSPRGRHLLATVRTLIVDEIHALAGNRRGSHLALSMERLGALAKQPVQRIGLSATQKPIEEVARFLVGTPNVDQKGSPNCNIVDCGFARELDLAIELPGAPLEAVMSNDVWTEVYGRLADLIEAHKTTLVFVNTRRLAERVTGHLCKRLGDDKVTSHHGSLSAALRLEAERRLKAGELKALVATASLELGIDIGSVDLVCQIGSARSIATFLQRVGRADHRRMGRPKGRLFPLSRDELVEGLAVLRSIRERKLDEIVMPQKPLDLLAQQIVACVACEEWDEQTLYELMRSAYPYRDLSLEEFEDVLRMLAEGFSTRRGRRAALIHHDAVNRRVRGRRGARLTALTSGGAIPDNPDYRVLLEPGDTLIGTVNEDFAIESMAGDIFQLGNASWRVLQVNAGSIRVEDARGQPPGIPFWLGEAPGRTAELSRAVSVLRLEIERKIEAEQDVADWFQAEPGLSEAGARQLADYFAAAYRALGVIPSQDKLVVERFFDESGGMQLVIHSPFGIRLNRAWGLALRKRFCRSFNFELQAAATDDAIVLSLGTQHSFPLDQVFGYLNSKTVRDLLVQAILDAPMFAIRWRWNAARALALPRHRGGHKVPAPLQRMESENLLAAIFPDQLACLENIEGDRVIPRHPLVQQTIEDCLIEAMDIHGLIGLLERIESRAVQCIALDLPEPSPLAHEILNAKPYAFLDNAPLEERRTQAVYTRRAGDSAADGGLGMLDLAAINKVSEEAWPRATNPDELHEALLLLGALTEDEARNLTDNSTEWLESLTKQMRAGRIASPRVFWVAAERWPMIQTIYPGRNIEPPLVAPEPERQRQWERADAVRELLRGRMEVTGPVTVDALRDLFHLPASEIQGALLALEGEGIVLRGKFHPGVTEMEWCDRRLLARIHRLTINKLRAEIQPVSIAEYQRFLLAWQRVDAEYRALGVDGVAAVLELLDGCELPAAAWEPEVIALRVDEYSPTLLDQLCFTGRIGWGRLTLPETRTVRPMSPVRSSPMSLFARESLPHWLALSKTSAHTEMSPDARETLESLSQGGALFFGEIVRRTRLLPSRVEQALAELAAQGCVTADGFEGLRALLLPEEKRAPFSAVRRRRHPKSVTSVEFGGRWSLLREISSVGSEAKSTGIDGREESVEAFARALLRRYGVVSRRIAENESLRVSWFELIRVFRRLEARGEIRGGYFVNGLSGEQFARPEAIGLLRSIRKAKPKGQLTAISAADPLNLVGILTPGPRIAAITGHRLLLRDGVPIAALKAGEVLALQHHPAESERAIENALRVGTMPAKLRPYYA
ncbi:MAG: DEAD/DEAH box helicase [Verrucomicrobia bacterium]|nr:DEAD/DEAH box helicase [Verrucomicrobiota bacterium]